MKTNDIFVTSVKKYTPPKYPTQTEVTFKPELLRKLPSRWQKNAAVVAAAGLFGAITLVSCGTPSSPLQETTENIQETPAQTTIGNITETTVRTIIETTTSLHSDSPNFLNVAPVFIHGDGTGSIGCVMIAPPVFLSEQEALAIIKNVAENEGLKFEAEPPEYTAVKNKPETKYSWENNYTLGEGNIGLDLYDDKKGVAVSYIAMEEAEQKYKNMDLSVTAYCPRELAELTVEDFAEQKGDMNIGILYEPGYDWGIAQSIADEYGAIKHEIYMRYENILNNYNEAGELVDKEKYEEYVKEYEKVHAEYEASVKVLIEENLRAQVRDFIEWLQGQGII